MDTSEFSIRFFTVVLYNKAFSSIFLQQNIAVKWYSQTSLLNHMQALLICRVCYTYHIFAYKLMIFAKF